MLFVLLHCDKSHFKRGGGKISLRSLVHSIVFIILILGQALADDFDHFVLASNNVPIERMKEVHQTTWLNQAFALLNSQLDHDQWFELFDRSIKIKRLQQIENELMGQSDQYFIKDFILNQIIDVKDSIIEAKKYSKEVLLVSLKEEGFNQIEPEQAFRKIKDRVWEDVLNTIYEFNSQYSNIPFIQNKVSLHQCCATGRCNVERFGEFLKRLRNKESKKQTSWHDLLLVLKNQMLKVENALDKIRLSKGEFEFEKHYVLYKKAYHELFNNHFVMRFYPMLGNYGSLKPKSILKENKNNSLVFHHVFFNTMPLSNTHPTFLKAFGSQNVLTWESAVNLAYDVINRSFYEASLSMCKTIESIPIEMTLLYWPKAWAHEILLNPSILSVTSTLYQKLNHYFIKQKIKNVGHDVLNYTLFAASFFFSASTALNVRLVYNSSAFKLFGMATTLANISHSANLIFNIIPNEKINHSSLYASLALGLSELENIEQEKIMKDFLSRLMFSGAMTYRGAVYDLEAISYILLHHFLKK